MASRPLTTKYKIEVNQLRDIKRSKFDDQMEEQLEHLAKEAWKHRKQLFIMTAITIPSAFVYLRTNQRPLLAEYLPLNQIENTAQFYFSKIVLIFIFLMHIIVIREVLIHYWNIKNYE